MAGRWEQFSLSYTKWDIPADLLSRVVLAKPPALVSGRHVFARTLTNGIWDEPEAVWFWEEGGLGLLPQGLALTRREHLLGRGQEGSVASLQAAGYRTGGLREPHILGVCQGRWVAFPVP